MPGLRSADLRPVEPDEVLMLEWTGERFIPGQGGSLILLEHGHRYALATTLVRNKIVLDVGSGEGYGSHWMAERGASLVLGVDVSEEAAVHAARNYPTAAFALGSAERLPIRDSSVDVVTCFEVIEHVSNPGEVVTELRRVLRPDGVMLISTPDKATYTDARHYCNEFHVSEMYRPEFEALLGAAFPCVRLLGQVVTPVSRVWSIDSYQPTAAVNSTGVYFEGVGAPPTALYFIALCSTRPVDLRGADSSTFSAHLEDDEGDLEAQLERGRAQLAIYEAQLRDLRNALEAASAAAATAAHFEAEASRLQSELLRLRVEVIGLRNELTAAQEYIAALEATKLFRVTAPARRVYGRLRHRIG